MHGYNYLIIYNGHPVDPGSRLNLKMSSYQYRDPHVKDIRRSRDRLIFNKVIPYLGKIICIYIGAGPWA